MTGDRPAPGQRWVSDSEPELGLGIILKSEFGRVEMYFPAAGEHRQYAVDSAPLRRVRYKPGDRIKLHDGAGFLVGGVEERAGLLVYHGDGREAAEAELSDLIAFSKPEDRLLGGQVDDIRTFDLRAEALRRHSAIRMSPVRGFVGGRVDLIPHQLSIAGEVASRLLPRVLLADEVGLGKTIEAGLIAHRLHLTGRAGRILILVPEPLIHQWFVEMLRRFNLLFSLFDEDRCASIEANDPDSNPFLDSQLVLCSVGFLAGGARRREQAVAAGWDLLVVDEAHHLEWTPQAPGPEYEMVAALAAATPGLLLLTATPQQLGQDGHFARLCLLDPVRYTDLGAFIEEAEHYEEVARTIDRVLAGKRPTARDRILFASKSERVRRHCDDLVAGNDAARSPLISELLDEFGTGRVLFRNTRAALSGFPGRKAFLHPLEPGGDTSAFDVRIKWLAALLAGLSGEKILLICRTQALAEEIHARLQDALRVSAALFHEGLTLLQRDRNAAFFAEAEGARILICSEIGSEGRNFQFAHHLALWDLPGNPELLEQRIGRLDRIGQTGTIHIHVPYVRLSAEEVVARWYHDGLNAFERSLHGAAELFKASSAGLSALTAGFDAAGLDAFLARTRERHADVAAKLERGQDRLLELNSSNAARADDLIRQIRECDADKGFEEFFIRVADHFGLHIEELGNRNYLLLPANLTTDAFPALPDAGLSVTFDRAKALSRDDLGFLTTDHPIVRGALDLLLGSEAGNASFAIWKTAGREAILLEMIFVVECVAPAALHPDRFLPVTPVRVVVDHALNDLSTDAPIASAALAKGDVFRLLDKNVVKRKLLPAMLARAQDVAAAQMLAIVAAATATMEARLQDEIERLEDLRTINDHVRPEEITAARAQKQALRAALASAHVRPDAVRLIWRMQE